MNEVLIDNKIIGVGNPGQIINMGGPWVGDLMVEGKKISGNVIIDNYYIDSPNHKLYFILYHHTSHNRFSLCYLDTISLNTFTYSVYFELIFIEKIADDVLIYYDAFHDKDKSLEKEIPLLKDGWSLYKAM